VTFVLGCGLRPALMPATTAEPIVDAVTDRNGESIVRKKRAIAPGIPIGAGLPGVVSSGSVGHAYLSGRSPARRVPTLTRF
jgi:hypothetical protein